MLENILSNIRLFFCLVLYRNAVTTNDSETYVYCEACNREWFRDWNERGK